MGKIIRFGIIGAGNMGMGHMGFFREGKVAGGVVTAVADFDPVKLKAARERFGDGFAAYASGAELIEKVGVDAVIVATPHYSHPELSIAALKKGLHVVCEKPAGVYTKQVEEMNAAAAKAGSLFTMMFNQRTNPLYKKMRDLVGEIGEIKRVNWIITTWYRTQSYYDSGSWRATWAGEGGGVLFNQCPHQLDLLQWVTGMMPSRVRAFCRFGQWHDVEVEDDVTAYLEYANGATGVFVTSTADTPGTNRFEVLGTKGKLVCENDKLVFWKLKTDERAFCRDNKSGFGQPDCEAAEIPLTGENPQHAGIVNNFIRAINGEEPLFVDGREGIESVRLMDAMLLSTWLDKAVELPFDGDLYLAELNKRVKASKRKNAASVTFNLENTFGAQSRWKS
jgi:predicted dehydrogenase